MSENTKITVEPKWNTHPIAIAMSSSEEYIPYLSVYLQSIVEHCSDNNKYDIIVFSTTNNQSQVNIITERYNSQNVSIRFVNPEEYFKGIKLEITHNYFHRACYYRLAAPNILKNYEKVIFTDIDMVAQTDFAKLYDTDLTYHTLAACIEPIWKNLVNDNKIKILLGNKTEITFKDYYEQILKLNDVERYYNTGVVVFNVKTYNENNCFERAIELIKENHFYFQEQCTLNALLNNEILQLEKEWNYEIDDFATYPENIIPNIIHYLGKDKPWINASLRLHNIWWEYAKNSPFYETIKTRYEKYMHENKYKLERKFKSKVFKYSILSRITIGTVQKRYQNKLELNQKRLLDLNQSFKTIDNVNPMFSDNYTAIAMSCSSKYIPYLSVCLQSLIEHTDPNHNYDIIVLERSIDEETKNILKNQVEAENISLRFINPMPIIEEYDLKVHSDYAVECYFRLASPRLLSAYKRVIFTDIDLIFNSDIKDLDNVDITNKPLAACKDLMFGAFLKYPSWDWLEYSKNVLKLKDPYKYFNTGVMIFNIEELNSKDFTKTILDLVSKTHFRILEQDGLNAFYQDNIQYLDTSWNYASEINSYKHLIKYMPEDFYQQYLKDKECPNIIHWAGADKPWFKSSEEFSDKWWKYAEKTPYIQQLKTNYAKYWAENKPKLVKKYKSKILKYNILSKILFGKKRDYYTEKLSRNKKSLEDILKI